MKSFLSAAALLCFSFMVSAQQPLAPIPEEVRSALSINACKCIDSIVVFNKTKEDITREINTCISRQADAYATGSAMGTTDARKEEENNSTGQISATARRDEKREQAGKLYSEIENYLKDHCDAVKEKITAWNQQQKKSFSADPQAMHYFTMGMNELEKENYATAIHYFQQAVLIDDQFAVAWNNVGLCCRKIGEYDKALAAYNKSLEIDPKGLMPLQNIAIVYQYQKEYDKAIEAFKKIAAIDPDNPEIYYGIGNIYTNSLNEEEKGLDNLCKAYSLYTKQNSPYTADAEKMIQNVYTSMKKQRKLSQFNEILKQNNITPM